MIHKFIFLLTFFLCQLSFAQNSESIYYDKEWKVTNKTNASYYREMPMKTLGELNLLRDFYMNGTPQFEGYVSKNDENAYVGDITWYDENGNDTTFRQYVNKSKNPTLTYYHANGKIRKTVQYKNGLKDGETIIYAKDGTVLMKGIYFKGTPKSGDFEIITEDYENNNSDEPQLQKTVGVEPPMPYSAVPEKTRKVYEKTVSQKIFWSNSNKLAQEKVYAIIAGDLKFIGQKNYDITGKLVQTLNENNLKKYSSKINDGTDYQYFLQNNFATGLQSSTNYIKGEKSGKSISYNPKGGIYSESNYREGIKEGEEITFDENGNQKSKRTYKGNDPFNGNFDEKIAEFVINSTYLNGQKEGESIAKNEQNEIVAKGIYKNGKPYKGTFITDRSSDQNNELINVENFKQTGLQKVFNYRLDNPEKTYTIQNEKLNGLTTFYNNDGKVIATLEYKNDEPYNGTLIGKKETTFYKNGKIEAETIYKDEYSKEENNISKKKFYENGVLVKILDQSFTIEEQPREVYEGIYKNGKPYSGYFVTDEDSEFKEIDYFENGSPKFQYSNNYLENMDNYRYQPYNIKSTYKDGKIFDGVEYVLNNRQFTSRNLKNGILQSFDWDLFAVNYFNRIHFELKGNSIEISDLQEKKKATIKIENSDKGFTKKLMIDGKLIETRNYSSAENASNKYYERVTLYFLKNGKISSATIDLHEKPNENYGESKFAYSVYNSIDDHLKTATEIFNHLSEEVSSGTFLDQSEDESTITAVIMDSSGKPKEGILITDLKNDIYNLQLFEKGKMIKSVQNIAFKDVEKEIKKLGKGY
ncbi:hypothetical protein IV494_12530 [Kaistella sp. G5-32]|uniref:Antitoxin component YwqK of YwqJK toxin-antitoxin module n=1 Tax=Kaistella gelatinilytica TaxID=2787636 RepID=A0ABS0FE64_9FLAO|nr:hypothetical protein [Kaistella gelatinilytica]MBF8458004.1 hypothetical protein [Kaistella gelatinilytica]